MTLNAVPICAGLDNRSTAAAISRRVSACPCRQLFGPVIKPDGLQEAALFFRPESGKASVFGMAGDRAKIDPG